MTCDRPECVWEGDGAGFGFSGVGFTGGVVEVISLCSSLISSSAVSVYRGADLTTFRATCRFSLQIEWLAPTPNISNRGRDNKGWIQNYCCPGSEPVSPEISSPRSESEVPYYENLCIYGPRDRNRDRLGDGAM